MTLNSLQDIPDTIGKGNDGMKKTQTTKTEEIVGSVEQVPVEVTSKPQQVTNTAVEVRREIRRREKKKGQGKGLVEFFIDTTFEIKCNVEKNLHVVLEDMLDVSCDRMVKNLNQKEMTVAILKTIIEAKGIEIASGAKKDDLIHAIINDMKAKVTQLRSSLDGKHPAEREKTIIDFLNAEFNREEPITANDKELSEKRKVPVIIYKEANNRCGGVFTPDGKTKICNFLFAADRERPFEDINWAKHSPELIMLFQNPNNTKIKIPRWLGLRYSNVNSLVSVIMKQLFDTYKPYNNRVNELQYHYFKHNTMDDVVNGIRWVKDYDSDVVHAFKDDIKIGEASIIRPGGNNLFTHWQEQDLSLRRNEMIQEASRVLLSICEPSGK